MRHWILTSVYKIWGTVLIPQRHGVRVKLFETGTVLKTYYAGF